MWPLFSAPPEEEAEVVVFALWTFSYCRMLTLMRAALGEGFSTCTTLDMQPMTRIPPKMGRERSTIL